MRHHSSVHFASSSLSIALLTSILFLSLPCIFFAQEPEKDSAGLIASDQASAKDVGLPVYPGSKRHAENSNESDSARLGLWGGGSGFKLALMKMESADSPEKLAAFYKKALAKYGRVLDCSNPSPTSADADKKDTSTALACDDDKPEKGGMLLKSGTKEKQHIVAIQPNGNGSLYQLVAVGSWGSDSRH